jgi:hypothetical protein
MAWVFQYSLDGTANLLIEQLEIVKAKGFAVQVSLDLPCQAKAGVTPTNTLGRKLSSSVASGSLLL